MEYQRCQGWMVNENFYRQGFFFLGWRWVFGGEILDPVILENRKDFRKPSSARNPGFRP